MTPFYDMVSFANSMGAKTFLSTSLPSLPSRPIAAALFYSRVRLFVSSYRMGQRDLMPVLLLGPGVGLCWESLSVAILTPVTDALMYPPLTIISQTPRPKLII